MSCFTCDTTIDNSGMFSPSFVLRNYSVGQQLGEGTQGKVFAATAQDTKVALKQVAKSKLTTSQQKGLLREIALTRIMQHPNIVGCYEGFQEENDIWVAMEFCPGKNLLRVVNSPEFTAAQRFHVFHGICNALAYLHTFSVCHRDLKMENIMVDDKFNAKLIDFGMATVDGNGSLTDRCGSPHYVAPEIVDADVHAYHGPTADMWSLGVMLYGLIVGSLPFHHPDMRVLLRQVMRGRVNFPETVDTETSSVIRALLCTDPAQRLTWPELARSPFWQSRCKSAGVSTQLPGVSGDKFITVVSAVNAASFIDPQITASLEELGNIFPIPRGMSAAKTALQSVGDTSTMPSKTLYKLLSGFSQRSSIAEFSNMLRRVLPDSWTITPPQINARDTVLTAPSKRIPISAAATVIAADARKPRRPSLLQRLVQRATGKQ